MDSSKKIKALEIEIENLRSRIRIDEKEKSYREQLVFLSDSALDLLGHTEETDLYQYIGQKLMQLVGNAVVIVSSYDVENEIFEIKFLGGIKGLLDRIINIMGHKPHQQKVRFKDKTLELMYEIPNKLHRFGGGLHESSDGTISKPIATALERLIQANEIWGIAYERNRQILGTATLITRGKNRIVNPEVIEAFSFQCSIAIHRQQLESELRLAKKEADRSNRLKTAFLANMSHEIRTPMNGILGLTSLLSDPDLDQETRKEYLDLVRSSGNVLLNLLDGIMDISRIEANQVIINKESFNLNKLIRELKGYYSSELLMLGKNRIDLEESCGLPDQEAWLHADQVKIRQILVNLIGNAVKFTERGAIRFGYKLQKRKEQLLFYVSDSGPGIKAELQAAIFEQFVQGDFSSTREYGGSGLGLAICKGFVDLMGGRIWLESKPGKGSEFSFTLPFEQPREQDPKVDHYNGSAKRNWKGRKILIVEDDYINYKLLEGVLKRCNAEILNAVTGKEAVEVSLGPDKPDLILMDLQLPEMNGFEAIKEIRKSKPDIPIIIQTANALENDKKKAEKLNCQGFITKPVNLGSFVETLAFYLEKPGYG